jgi:hypothetical protein
VGLEGGGVSSIFSSVSGLRLFAHVLLKFDAQHPHPLECATCV